MPLGSIVGHAPIVALLRQAVARGRVPQSLLFAGPAGVGKRAVAIALAQAINCPTRRARHSDDACGVCPTCDRISRGQHSDVTLIDKGDEASIKIDVLRKRLLEVIGYRPFEGERRVFIIDPADDMGDQAQDALLKTLEEPPPASILILVSEYADTLAATIQSRCRRLRFGPLSETDVARVLERAEKIDPVRARALAAASGGSISRALEESAGDFVVDRSAAMSLLAAARARDVGTKLRAAAALASNKSPRRDREALGARLAIVSSLLRDLGVLASGSPAPLANVDLASDLQSLHQAFDLARVTRAYDTIDRAQDALERNAGPKIVADWVGVTV